MKTIHKTEYKDRLGRRYIAHELEDGSFHVFDIDGSYKFKGKIDFCVWIVERFKNSTESPLSTGALELFS